MKQLTRYFIVLLLSGFMFLSKSVAQDIKTFIPLNATKYLPVLKAEVNNNFNEIVTPWYFGGLIEQESCISLRHSRCWLPTSSLKTSREEGAGIGQLTRAYKVDGTLRFDSLSDLRKAHMTELKELSWSNVYQRPDLQIRGLLLMSRDNYKGFFQVTTQLERLKMTDAAYNSGSSSVRKRRLQCGLTKGCNPQVWDGNVGSMKVLSSKPIYGTRSPQFINDEHVEMIFHKRMNKYEPYFK